MNRRLREGLAGIPGVYMSSPDHPALGAAITSFGVEGMSPRALQNALWQEKIRVRAQRNGVGVRFCCHIDVDPDDVDRALDVVRRLT